MLPITVDQLPDGGSRVCHCNQSISQFLFQFEDNLGEKRPSLILKIFCEIIVCVHVFFGLIMDFFFLLIDLIYFVLEFV